ncbi:MAG: holin, partial [Catonella sp.]
LEDLTTFETLGKLFVSLFSNPYLIGLTFVNAFNLIPDPTTAGLGDSEQALTYEAPKES